MNFLRLCTLLVLLLASDSALCGPSLPSSHHLDQLLYQIRDPATGAAAFRAVLEAIGECLGAAAMEELVAVPTPVITLTGAMASHQLLVEPPVLVTILRAGLPLHAGLQKLFPNAPTGFIGMARNETTLRAKTEYLALPELSGRVVILADTMLATGGSICDALAIIQRYHPRQVIVVAAIASEAGIANIQRYDPSVRVIAAAVDPLLNDRGYIVPGLGDAGDRAYGEKSSIPADPGHEWDCSCTEGTA